MGGFWERALDRELTGKGLLLFVVGTFFICVAESMVGLTGMWVGLVQGIPLYLSACAFLKPPFTYSRKERRERKLNEFDADFFKGLEEDQRRDEEGRK